MTPYDRNSVMHYQFLSCGIDGNYGYDGFSDWDKLALHIMYPEDNRAAEFIGTTVIRTGSTLSLQSAWQFRGANMSYVATNFQWRIDGVLRSTAPSLSFAGLGQGTHTLSLTYADFIGRNYSYTGPVRVVDPLVYEGYVAALAPNGGECTVTFGDVPVTFWASNYIVNLYCRGITTGCSQSPLNYCPGTTVNRQQMAAFIIRAKYGENFTYTPSPYFTDVPATSPFFKYVQKMKDEGITTGCNQAGPLYCPSSNVTRQAMAAFIIRARYGESFTYTPTAHFADVAAGNQFFKYVQKMKDEGVTTGCNPPSNDNYCPAATVNRAQMGAFLGRAFLGMP
jgi:hypothetical protein